MKTFDAVELAVRFYSNQGQLKKVEEATGVSVAKMEKFLSGTELSFDDRNTLVESTERNQK